MSVSVSIESLAISMPKKHYTNDMPPYSEISNIPKTWWRFWGIKGRHLIDKSIESAESLAIEACSKALKNANTSAEDIDLILVNSTCLCGWSDEHLKAFPRFSDKLKKELNCPNALAIDVEQECITFLISLQIAANYISTGVYKKVLVCSSEYISGVLDFSDLSSTTFGDGAAAAVVTNNTSNGELLSSAFKSNADFYDIAVVKWQYPENKAVKERKPEDYWSYFTLNKDAPEEMQKFVPVGVPTTVKEALDKVKLTPQDIDFYVFHQPSKILVNLWANGLDIDEDKFMLTLEHYGCMVSVSMPVTFYESIRQNKIKEGDTIVIGGAATGWGFGAQVWKVGKININ